MPATVTAPFTSWFSTAAERANLVRQLTDGNPGGYEAVYLATPPRASGDWLDRLLDARVRLIAVEKPWFGVELADAQRLVARVRGAGVACRFIDHHLAHPAMRYLLTHGTGFYLGGPARRVIGRFLEEAAPASPAMGQAGANLDMLIHLVSDVRGLFPGCAVGVHKARFGRTGAWPYATECFVRAWGEIDGAGGPVHFDLAAGKHCPSTAKYLRLDGTNGSALVIDFVEGTITLARGDERRRVFPFAGADTEPAYRHIIRRVADSDTFVGVSAEEALTTFRVLDEVRRRAGYFLNYTGFPAWMPAE
jgi:hypothetical protein